MHIKQLHEFEHIVPISALNGNNTGKLVSLLISILPEGPSLFPGDQMTDRTETFQISELVREKVFLHTHQEIPYSVGVLIEEIEGKYTQWNRYRTRHDSGRTISS